MHQVDITKHYIALMHPLIPQGKFALEIHGQPLRKNEKSFIQEITSIARKHHLHRKVKHAQAYITIKLNATQSYYGGNFIELNFNALTYEDHVRRVAIIVSLLVLLIVLAYLNKKSSH